MAQVAPAVKPALSLTHILSNAWTRFVRSSNQSLSKGMYGEDIAFSDSLERELSDRELHPYTY
jgi:hypothetical protein